MDKLIQKVNRRSSMGMAAALISVSYLISRLLGLFRDRLLAAHFGISAQADAYAAAFRLPELLFTLLVSGAFAVAFIPVLTEHWEKKEHEEAWMVSSGILNLLVITTLLAGGLIFIFAGPLTHLIAPGFDNYRYHLAVNLTRIMLATPFLFAISSVFGSIQQSFNRFFFYSIAGIFYNLGIIFGIIVLSPHYGIYGPAIGVDIGAAAQMLVQVLGVFGLGYRWRPNFNFRHKSVTRVVKLMIPRSIDQGIDQINYTVQVAIGSKLAAGSLIAYYYANNLKNVPLVIFGSAIAQAAFPNLARSSARENRTSLIAAFVTNIRMILFLILPSAVIAILMRGYIVRLLFGFGSPITASLLGWFSGVIVFESLFFLVARMYYAHQDTKTPLYTSIVAIGGNVVLSIVLVNVVGINGLPMAQSSMSAFETLLLLGILKYRFGHIGLSRIFQGLWRMLVSSMIMASVVYILITQVFPLYASDKGFEVIAPKFLIIMAAAFAAYLIPSYLMRLDEAKRFIGKVRAQTLRPSSLD